MARVSSNGKNFALSISPQDFNSLGLGEAKDYELVRVKHGLYVLFETETERPAQPEPDCAGERIIKLLGNKKMLPQRVEGKFEKLLSDAELVRFQEMLQSGEVERFKLSPKYKNFVYQLREKKKKPAQKPAQKDPAPGSGEEECPTLSRNGYMVVGSEALAKKISEEQSADIKSGKILGIKSFDGSFYVIKSDIYEKTRAKIDGALSKKPQIYLDELAKELNADKTLLKTACEFMKEDGTIIEKRRELYRLC